MVSEWEEFSLADLYEVSSGLSKPAKDFGSGYPFLSFKDVFNNFFVPNELKQLVQSSKKEQSKCSIKRGDVFLTRTSETMHELGMSSVSLKDYEKATFNGFTKRLRPKTNKKIIPEFIGYYLRSPMFRQEMLAFSTMSTRASLNNEMISRLKITLPPEKTQSEIAHILKSLDDKIELNKKINQTLEQMAQAMFKSWFVDFDPVFDNLLEKHDNNLEKSSAYLTNKGAEDLIPKLQQHHQIQQTSDYKPLPDHIRKEFPNDFQRHDDMGWIPEGWPVSTTNDEFDIYGGGTPSTKNPAFWKGGAIHWTTPKDLSSSTTKVLLDTDRKITEEGLSKISSGLLPINTVLMSSRAPVGYLALAKVPIAINQGYIALKCENHLSPFYTIQWLNSILDEIKGVSGGTTFQEISKKTFRAIKLIVPNPDAISLFTNFVSGLYDSIETNLRNEKALTLIRDSLLPKLISGEINLGDKGE